MTAGASGFSIGAAASGHPIFLGANEAREDLDITLSADGVRLAGVVLDALGGPVGYATVRAVRASLLRAALDVVTDADGGFSFSLAPGPVALSAQAAGYASARAFPVAPTSDVKLVLTPGGRIHGHVVMAGNHNPVANVQVRALRRNRGPRSAPAATSDSRGEFTIDGLEPDVYALRAQGDHVSGNRSAPLRVELGESVRDVVVEVDPAARVTGRVVNEGTGEPCERGELGLGPMKPERSSADGRGPVPSPFAAVPLQIASIQQHGRVQFDAIPPGRYEVVVKCHEQLRRGGPSILDVTDRDIEGIEWTVERGIRLAVRVVDARDRPVPHAGMTLKCPESPGHPASVFNVAADANGRFDFGPTLPPGDYTLEPNDEDGDSVLVKLDESSRTHEATLRLKGSGTILVAVRTPQGDMLDGLAVAAHLEERRSPTPHPSSPLALPGADGPMLSMRNAIALGNGSYRIGPLSDGIYAITVEDGVNPPAPSASNGDHLAVADGATVQADVILDRGGTLTGQVLDETGQPASDVWVSALYEQQGGRKSSPSSVVQVITQNLGSVVPRVLTDVAGRFELTGLQSAARYTVRAEDTSGATGLLRNVAPERDVLIRLPVLGVLGGTAADQAGQAVSEFVLQMQNVDVGRASTAHVALHGDHWRVEGVLPGRVQLSARDAAGRIAEQSLDLPGGQARLDLRLVFAPEATSDPAAQVEGSASN